MKQVTCQYSEEELGWVSEDIFLTGDTLLSVKLKENGKMVIKRRGQTNPKILVSPECTDLEIKISGLCKNVTIQVITSVEPESVETENI